MAVSFLFGLVAEERVGAVDDTVNRMPRKGSCELLHRKMEIRAASVFAETKPTSSADVETLFVGKLEQNLFAHRGDVVVRAVLGRVRVIALLGFLTLMHSLGQNPVCLISVPWGMV